MKNAPLSLFVLTLCLAGCAASGPDHVYYNEDRGFFLTHPATVHQPPRLMDGSLVGYDNLVDFTNERTDPANRKTAYRWVEDTVLLRANDYKLGQHYEAIRLRFEADDPNAVFGLATSIRQLHPRADWYSNLSFLEGRAFEQLGLDTEAHKKYQDFLRYSARLLPGRHRGAWMADPGDSLYLLQRQYARNVLDGHMMEPPTLLPPCPPRFVYQPHQPGFPEGREFLNRKVLHLYPFLERNYGIQWGGGVQVAYRFTPSIMAFAEVSAGKQYQSFRVGIPLQLYQAPNDRFGIKFTPYLSFNTLDSLKTGNSPQRLTGHFFDGGLRLSMGYYLLPTLSIGAYGDYHLRNRQHPWTSPEGQPIYTPNEVDVSLYYGFLENVAIKAGVKNEHLVVGLFMVGWELSWSLNKGRLIIRHSLD